ENLTNHKDDAYLSYDLATIKRDSQIEISLEDLNYSGYEDDDVIELFQTLEFRSLIERMGGEQKVEEEVILLLDIMEEVTKDSLLIGSILKVEMIDENYQELIMEAISLV